MSRAFFNERAAVWDENFAEKDTSRLRELARVLDLKPGSVVLDAGTGTGVFLPFILDRIGEEGRIVALDYAQEMLKRTRAKNLSHNIVFLCADVVNLPLPDAVFDCIVCYSSFPHFRNKPKALAQMNRVLKAGGALHICHTSSRERINQIHSQISVVKNDFIPDDAEMKLMLKGAGFGNISIEANGKSYLVTARKRVQD